MAKKSWPTPPSSGSSSDEEEQTTSKKPAPETPAPETSAHKNKEEEESDDDSEDESESESESGEEEEEDEDKSKIPQPSPSTPARPASDSGASGSGSGSEDEESDSDSEAAKLVIPISSKPMAEAPAEKANGKVPFQRIWTSDDEISVLKSLVQFQSNKGLAKLNPNSLGEFYEMVKNKISAEVNCHQLVEKLKRLKKRYLVMASHAEGGKTPQFAKLHDQALYDLGKKLWVEDDGSMGTVSNGVAAIGTKLQSSKFLFLEEAVRSIGKRSADEALEKLDPAKTEALDKRLKKQMVAEMKIRLQEAELWKETMKLLKEGIERAKA